MKLQKLCQVFPAMHLHLRRQQANGSTLRCMKDHRISTRERLKLSVKHHDMEAGCRKSGITTLLPGMEPASSTLSKICKWFSNCFNSMCLGIRFRFGLLFCRPKASNRFQSCVKIALKRHSRRVFFSTWLPKNFGY